MNPLPQDLMSQSGNASSHPRTANRMRLFAYSHSLFLCLLVLVSLLGYADDRADAAPTTFKGGEYAYRLIYTVNSSAAPDLTHNEVSIKIKVGSFFNAEVLADSVPISTYRYDSASQSLIVTTTGANLDISVNLLGPPPADFADVEVAQLKDNKKWAWSHGFDDNTFLANGMALFESYGWRGTLFLIGSIIDDTRDQDWIVDAPAIRRAVSSGWGVGSHSWETSCTDYNQAAISQSMDRLEGIIDTSSNPDYKVISFAAPCFVADYHPVILAMRDGGSYDVHFNESGADYLLQVDSGTAADYSAAGQTAKAFDYDLAIGRDPSISYNTGDPNDGITEVDWMAAHASDSRHFWYNTLAHGNGEAHISPLLAHVYNNYGSNGTDEAWVAPSDQIYSYLLRRDNTTVAFVSQTQLPQTIVITQIYLPISQRP